MSAPTDYKNQFLKKPPKRLAVVDQNSCSGCANSPACVTFCETVTVKDQVVDAIRYITSPELPNNLAIIQPEKCIGCALCAEVCPWDAIHMYNFEEAWDEAAGVTLVLYTKDNDRNPAPDEPAVAGAPGS